MRINGILQSDISEALEAVLDFMEENGFDRASTDLRYAWAERSSMSTGPSL